MSDLRAVHSPLLRRHAPGPVWLLGEEPQPHPDTPERLDALLAALKVLKLPVHAPRRFEPEEHWKGVHAWRYVRFLETAHALWREKGYAGPLRPLIRPRFQPAQRARDVRGQAGWHMADDITPFDEATAFFARASADVALSAAHMVIEKQTRTAYALCRPAGRHAGFETMAGFCYVNNAALAAKAFLRAGYARVALVSLGLHHAHGTQEIFFDTDRVYTLSVHLDPDHAYPFYTGREHERGRKRGYGFNLNVPLPRGSDDDVWCGAVDYVCSRLERYRPQALVLSLGFGMMRGDCPWEGTGAAEVGLSGLARMARSLSGLQRPTVIVQEGGWTPENLERGLTVFLSEWAERIERT